jgi:hypothetical protein
MLLHMGKMNIEQALITLLTLADQTRDRSTM